MFNCKNCGNPFTPTHSAAKYVNPDFCSKSCKTIVQMGGYKNKQKLEEDILEVICNRGAYQTLQDITRALGISSKTLNKFKISILKLNQKAGMRKPHSVFENKVLRCLEEIFDPHNIISQTTFETLVSPKGYPLRFDFLIEDLRIIVEADGLQHTMKDHYMSSDYARLCDTLKNEWCTVNNYTLVRIPYTKKVDLLYIEKHLNLLSLTTTQR